MDVKWTKRASKELYGIYCYISADDRDAAYKVVERIEDKADLLGFSPYIGTKGLKKGTLETTVYKTSCILVYRVFKKHVSIIHVIHGATRKEPRY